MFKKTGKQPQVSTGSDIERKDRQYTYSEVLEMTKNLQEKLGEGSFSIVYRGSVGDTQVAVKILNSQKTTKRDFKNEVWRLLVFVLTMNMQRYMPSFSFCFYLEHALLLSFNCRSVC